MAPLPIIHNAAYVAELPPGHRFPMRKFAGLATALVEERLVSHHGYLQPDPAPPDWIALAHDPAYVAQVIDAEVPLAIVREIGFPMTPAVALRSRTASAGTLLTARQALRTGLACNTAGGSHHARRLQGSGFCVFNDVAVAIRVLMAEGAIQRPLVVDLDCHQGDGTADIFTGEDAVFTFSMHGEKNFPARKIPSDRDVALPDGTGDDAYLAALDTNLAEVLDIHQPDFVFYNAGVDVHAEDRLGRLALSNDGIAARDRLVLTTVRARGLPVACVIGGGYSEDVDHVVGRHMILFRTAAELV